MALVDGELPSGRYRAAELAAAPPRAPREPAPALAADVATSNGAQS
jgi:hypothetical protein